MDIRMLDIDQCPDKYHIPNSFKDTHKCDDKSSYVSKKFRLLKVDLQEKLDTSLKAVFWLSRECSSLNRRSRLSPVTCFQSDMTFQFFRLDHMHYAVISLCQKAGKAALICTSIYAQRHVPLQKKHDTSHLNKTIRLYQQMM